MPKFTSVSSEIKAEQKQALKDMNFKQKLSYFWYYYKVHTIVGIGAVILIGWFVHDYVTSKDIAFYAIMLNAYNLNGEAIGADFSDYIELDTEEYICHIDTTSYLDQNEYSEYSMATSQRIMALVQIGDLDTIFTLGGMFGRYAEGGLFTDLRTVLSDEELALYQEHFYYVDLEIVEKAAAGETADQPADAAEETATGDETAMTDAELAQNAAEIQAAIAREIDSHHYPEQMQNPVPVGIYMADAGFIQKNGGFLEETPVYGIVASSNNTANACAFLNYLWHFDGEAMSMTGGGFLGANE